MNTQHPSPSRKERALELLRANRLQEAMALCEAAARGEDNPGAWSLLGVIHGMLGNLSEAEACNRRAVELRPDYAEGHCNLGVALEKQWRLDEAEASYRRALALRPEHAVAWKNLGNALESQGRVAEAIACYRRAHQVQPDYATAHSNELFLSLHQTGIALPAVAAMHREWNDRHAAPLRGSWQPFEVERDPHRRLNLGFVSGDLRIHPVGYFTVRALEALRRENANLFFYANQPEPGDGLTARFRAAAHTWRNVLALTDDELVRQIRQDRIDVLFDLTGHNAANRLRVFAHRPAPIQVSWAGYMATTGLAAMDYLIADRYEIPPGSEAHYTERILRLPDAFICYDPPADAPAVSPPPASANGFVTFGCFNRLSKITAEGVAAWSEILRRVPRARLVLKTRELSCSAAQRRYAGLFQEHGIGRERITYLGQSSHAEHLDAYNRIDLQLDTFPYSGSTTTLESLWMGVPVVTLPNDTFAGRHSLTFLSNLGLTDWVARDAGHYIELAVKYAGDPARLAALRATLRPRLGQSPICDGPRFAAHLMDEIRNTWRAWCAEPRSACVGAPSLGKAQAHHQLGMAQAADSRLDEAIASFREAIRLQPDRVESHFHLGAALAANGKLEAASARFREAIRLDPRHPVAHALLGNSLAAQGRPAEAVDHYRRALALRPDDVETLNNLGNALADTGHADEAIACYRQAIERAPDFLQAHVNLGIAHLERGDVDEAIASFRQALALGPDHAEAHTGVGTALTRRGRTDEAIGHYRRALALRPDYPEALFNLGNALREKGDTEQALRCYRQAVHLRPDYAEAHVNLAITLLARGDFRAGWEEYRWQWTRVDAPTRLFRPSAWNGANLGGKNVFLYAEQGLGDELFFLRFVDALRRRDAGPITYLAHPKIASLLRRVPVITRVAGPEERPVETDWVFSVGDLPQLLGMERVDQIPPPVALTPLPERIAALRQRLAALGAPPYVGVTWRAGTTKKNALYKESPLAPLAAVLKGLPGTVLVLQRHPAAGEVEAFQQALGRPVHDFSALNEDLESMLALLSLLDDYVGVSNTNMHLRAAVGKTARVLVPAPPEWRWMAEGRESPWFPGFGVYRQGYDGDWDTAFVELAADLKKSLS